MPQKPDGYSARKAEDLLSAYPEADIPEGQRVNVIATMLESFSDLSVFGTVSDRFVQDPYADFHALQAESYTGTLISDTIGGGTINAERAFLTATPTRSPATAATRSPSCATSLSRAMRRRAAIPAMPGSTAARRSTSASASRRTISSMATTKIC